MRVCICGVCACVSTLAVVSSIKSYCIKQMQSEWVCVLAFVWLCEVCMYESACMICAGHCGVRNGVLMRQKQGWADDACACVSCDIMCLCACVSLCAAHELIVSWSNASRSSDAVFFGLPLGFFFGGILTNKHMSSVGEQRERVGTLNSRLFFSCMFVCACEFCMHLLCVFFAHLSIKIMVLHNAPFAFVWIRIFIIEHHGGNEGVSFKNKSLNMDTTAIQ